MNLLVLDIETTGLDPDKNCIVSIAAKLFDKDRKVLSSYVTNCFDNKAEIHLQALTVNRFTLGELNQHRSEKEALSAFVDWLLTLSKTEEVTVSGHNVAFDTNFLKKRLKNINMEGFDSIASYKVIDTASLGGLLILSGYIRPDTKISLASLVKELGLAYNPSKHHSAEYDVEITANLLFAMVDLLKSKV